MGSIELFLNFMIMDINRNALRKNRDSALQSKIDQLTALWGDGSWEDAAFSSAGKLFVDPTKVSNEEFELAWRERVKTQANVQMLLRPFPTNNKKHSITSHFTFPSSNH